MAVSRNPCRYCCESSKYTGRHFPGGTSCRDCKYIKEHREYLKSKRKFVPGDPITSLPELLEQTWVMWYGHTKHIEMFKSMSIRTVEGFLRNGAFKKAIRKE